MLRGLRGLETDRKGDSQSPGTASLGKEIGYNVTREVELLTRI